LWFISPSLLREYLFCPRSFFYRRLQHYSLISFTNGNIVAQERIDAFTSGFFSTLNKWNEKTSLRTLFDLEYLLSSKFSTHLKYENQAIRELYEKVFTLLLWLIVHLWKKRTPNDEIPYYLPLMVNEFIQAPGIHLQGRPSAVFRQPNESALILIQTFHQKFLQIHSFQPAIYARILQTKGINAQDYLFVNYHRMDFKFQHLKQSDFDSLDIFLKDFANTLREGNFDPPKNPPCELCEFKWICQD